jgi:nucleotidyltransferase/DNA polymerase involved in DNA repair
MIAALVLEPLELWWARRLRPEWRAAPLVALRQDRVQHATAEARREGITSGMSLSGARLRCEELRVTEVSEAELRAAWESVLRELYGLSPFLDGTRRGRLFLSISAAEARMVAEAYDARVGHAEGCEAAELAALSTRVGRCRVLPKGSERAFLARLPLRFLRGVGLSGHSLQRLGWLGLSNAGELASWRRGQLRAFLGEEADHLAPYLHGPRRQRLPLAQPPLALRKTMRFEEPLFEPGPLEAVLERLAEALEGELAGRAAARLTLAAEVGGVEMRSTRFAKKPLRSARDIALLAGLALADSGAAPVGVEALTLELPEPVRPAVQGRLWPARERREGAWEELLERFPGAAVEVEWLDPYAESADLAWRWRHPAGGDELAVGEELARQEAAQPVAAASVATECDGGLEAMEAKHEANSATRSGGYRERQAHAGELVLGRGQG